MILTAVFITLFAAWMLLGWLVGESRDIRWMRNWCAGIFVVLAILICLGGGAMMARKMTQASCRSTVQQVSRLLNERIQQGRIDDVKDAIEHIAEEPGERVSRSPDILTRLEEVREALEKTSRPRVTAKPQQGH